MERGWLGSVPVLRVPDAPCHHSSSVELGLAEPGGHCQLSVLSLKSPQWCPEARCCPTAWQMRKRTKSAGEPCAPSKGSVTWATPTPSPTHLQSGFSVKKKKTQKCRGKKRESCRCHLLPSRISNTHGLLGGIICSQILHPSAACRVGEGGVLLAGNLWRNIPDSSVGKESACNAGDPGSMPGLGRSSGEGNGYPLQYSGLENSRLCSPRGCKESDTTEGLSFSCQPVFRFLCTHSRGVPALGTHGLELLGIYLQGSHE